MRVSSQLLSHVHLFLTPWTMARQAPLSGIFQARILEWVAISYSRGLPDPGIKPTSLMSLTLEGRFFTTVPPGKPLAVGDLIQFLLEELSFYFLYLDPLVKRGSLRKWICSSFLLLISCPTSHYPNSIDTSGSDPGLSSYSPCGVLLTTFA